MYSENEDENENDNVRPPDPIRLERLIGGDDPLEFYDSVGGVDYSVGGVDYSVDQDILNMILKQSAEEHNKEIPNQIHDSSEDEDIMNKILKQTAEEHYEEIMNQLQRLDRKTHFVESKKVFLRLSHIDKENADMYNQALCFITMYEDGYITRQSVSLKFNMDFFEMIAKIRVPAEEIGRWTMFLYVD